MPLNLIDVTRPQNNTPFSQIQPLQRETEDALEEERQQTVEWKPMWDSKTTREAIDKYYKSPNMYNEKYVEQLEKHADFYHHGFSRDPEEREFNLLRGIQQAGQGFIEGFTTFRIGDESANTYERIMRSAGHLAGFVGFIPGLGLLGKGIRGLKMVKNTEDVLTGLSKLQGASIPMLAGKAATKQTSKLAELALKRGGQSQSAAVKAASRFLSGDKARHIASGAFELGVASGVSSWQGGVDQMMQGFIGGAQLGGGFRVLSNLVKLGNPIANKAVNSIASSLYDGLPETMRGATAPEQIYAYLMGAYFGVRETTAEEHAYMRFKKAMEKEKVDPATDYPQQVSVFDSFDDSTKEYIKEQHRKAVDKKQAITVAHRVFEDMGVPADHFRIKESVNEFGEATMEIVERDPNAADIEILGTAQLTQDGKKESQPILAIRKAFPEENPQNYHNVGEQYNMDIGQTTAIPMKIVQMVPKLFKGFDQLDGIQRSELVQERALELNATMNDLTRVGREKDSNPIDRFQEWFNDKYDEDLTTEGRNEFLKWFETRLSAEQPRYITVLNGKVSELSALSPITRGLTSKQQLEPKKLIDFIWESKRGDEMENLPAFFIHDHYTERDGEANVYRDLSFTDKLYAYDMEYRGTNTRVTDAQREEGLEDQRDLNERYGIDESLPEDRRANIYARERLIDDFIQTAEQMHGKGYYYLSGKGDNERNYFAHYHPELAEAPVAIHNTFHQVLKAVAPLKKDRDPILNEDMEEFVSRYERNGVERKVALDRYKRQYVSNVLYHLDMNGKQTMRDGRVNLDAVRELVDDGYVNNPIAFNKRQQIFFTNGFGTREHLIDFAKIGDTSGEFNYVIVNTVEDDPNYRPFMQIGDLAENLIQSDDGHITVRRDVLEQLNAANGMMEDGEPYKQLKSFLVSQDADLGTLLGKMMWHEAGEAQSAAMEEAGIHMIIPTTSAKQTGKRKKYWHDVNDDSRFVFRDNDGNEVSPETYSLKPSDVRTVFSEVTDSHYMEPQRIPKQMFTNLTPFADTSIDPDVINGMYTALVDDAFKGSTEVNRMLERYIEHPGDTELRDQILMRLDEVNVQKLMNVIRGNGMDDFTEMALSQIVSKQHEYLRDQMAGGELDPREADKFGQVTQDFASGTDRLLRLNPNLPAHLHKYSRDYVQQVLHNYVVHRVTRPQRENSLTARMRPIDKFMLKTEAGQRVNENDRLFLLDSGFKKMPLRFTEILPNASREKPVTITLGELWKRREKGVYDDEVNAAIDGFLEGLGVRVPMDSISGADALQFGGFTDRGGYGIVMHPRTMEMLGGADLDGDKAWMFFGMKESWKDMYKKNREEFVERRRLDTGELVDKEPLFEVDRAQTGDFFRGKKIRVEQARRQQSKKPSTQRTKVEQPEATQNADTLTRQRKETLQSARDAIVAMKKDVKPGTLGEEMLDRRIGIEVERLNKSLIERGQAELSDQERKALRAGRMPRVLKQKQAPRRSDDVESLPPSQVAARNTGDEIRIDPEAITEQWTQKAWTRSNYDEVRPLPRNFFRSRDEWATFVMLREQTHDIVQRQEGESRGAYEQRVNEAALNEFNTNYRMDEYAPTGKFFMDAKSRYAKSEGLAEEGGGMKTRAHLFSPWARKKISDAAYMGRKQLGPNVVSKQSITAAHAAAVARGTENTHGMIDWDATIEMWRENPSLGERGKGPTRYIVHKVTVNPKTDKKSIRDFMGVARAAINISADPMDFADIATSDHFIKSIFTKAFDVKVERVVQEQNNREDIMTPNRVLRVDDLPYDQISGRHIRTAPDYRTMHDINKAYYGRNYRENRIWSYDETVSLTEAARALPESQRNTFMPKVAKTLENVNWYDSVLRRLDGGFTKELYETYQNALDSGRFDRVLNAIGRISQGRRYAQVQMNKRVKDAVNDKLWLASRRNEIANNERLYRRYVEEYGLERISDVREREKQLHQIATEADDYITNDLSDMATFTLLAKKTLGMADQRIDYLHKLAEDIKEKSYLLAQHRKMRKRGKDVEGGEIIEREAEEIAAGTDQTGIDKQIMQEKRDMTPQERDVFDIFLLGSVNRGPVEEYRGIVDQKKKMTPAQKSRVKLLRKELQETHVTKLGLNSEAVSDQLVREYFGQFADLMNTTIGRSIGFDAKRVLDDVANPEASQEPVQETQRRHDLYESHHAVEDLKNHIAQKETLKGDEHYYARGLSKQEPLTDQGKRLVREIREHIERYGRFDPKSFNQFFEWATGKSVNSERVTMNDWEDVNRRLWSMRNGSIFSQIFNDIHANNWGPEIARRITYMFPQAIDREHIKYDLQFIDRIRAVETREGVVEKTVKQPIGTMGRLQEYLKQITEKQQSEKERISNEIDLDFSSISSIRDVGGRYQGEDIMEMTVAAREIGLFSDQYENGMITVVQNQRAQGHLEDAHADNAIKTYRENWEKVADDFEAIRGVEISPKFRKENEPLLREMGLLKAGEKMEGDKSLSMSVEQYMQFLNNNMTRWVQKIYNGPVNGNRRKLMEHMRPDGNLNLTHIIDTWRDKITSGDPIDIFEDFNYGLPGLSKIAHEVRIANADDPRMKDMLRQKQREIADEPQLPFELYFPHMNRNKGEMTKSLREAAKKALQDESLSDKERAEAIQEILVRYKSLESDWMNEELADWEQYDEVVAKIRADREAIDEHGDIPWERMSESVGNLNRRLNTIPGYDMGIGGLKDYTQNIIDASYRQIGQIMNREVIREFGERMLTPRPGDRWDGNEPPEDYKEWVRDWQLHFSLYVQDSLGYPSNIPQWMADRKGMKIKGTAYYGFADNRVRQRLEKIWNKLNPKAGDLPSEFRELSHQQIKAWSNLEAKYELMTLLAHPKSAAANLFGGHSMTMISAGPRNWLKGRNTRYLTENIDSSLETREAIDRFVIQRGIIEEFITREAGLDPRWKTGKGEAFFKEAMSVLEKDPMARDKTLIDIAKKHGLGEAIFDAGAWFMRRSERALRRDAYMAHLVQAFEQTRGGVENPMQSEYLHQMAKKGVEATQFLYANHSRPAFARSALGKVMTRFQLWAWNSVRFRKDIINEAKIRGFREGTQEFDRFRRLMITDIFTLGLANVFAWSIFESALPTPWSWMKDVSEWLFGDEEERDRAFFGAYPTEIAFLQPITPPIMRMLPPLFKSMVENDYGRLGDYYAWTMFPFGRAARDLREAYRNPISAVNRVTGLPFIQVHSEFLKRREEEYINPRGIINPEKPPELRGNDGMDLQPVN